MMAGAFEISFLRVYPSEYVWLVKVIPCEDPDCF